MGGADDLGCFFDRIEVGLAALGVNLPIAADMRPQRHCFDLPDGLSPLCGCSAGRALKQRDEEIA